jgi:hypothetical protein
MGKPALPMTSDTPASPASTTPLPVTLPPPGLADSNLASGSIAEGDFPIKSDPASANPVPGEEPTPTPTSDPPVEAAVFLIIDEDSVDNGIRFHPDPVVGQQNIFPETVTQFSTTDVNDDKAGIGQRDLLRYFADNTGRTVSLLTGQTGDEGWFAPTHVPAAWGPTAQDGISNFIGGTVPQDQLDKVPGVQPLRSLGLVKLIGKPICAVVYDSDVSINYGSSAPWTDGNLQGETLGIVAFKALDVVKLTGFSSSSLPEAQVEILDANSSCAGAFHLQDAPIPESSSVPNDVDPANPPASGYRIR